MQPLVKAAASLFYENNAFSETSTGKLLCFVAGGFACSGKGNPGDMNVGAGLMEFGEDTLTDLAGLIGGAFGKKDNYLTELLIGTLRNNIRYAHVGA